MSAMVRPSWARLAASFPPSPSTWVLRELSPDRLAARVAAVLTADAIRSRLDDVVTNEGWSFQLLPLSARAIVCNLTVEGVSRSGVYELPAGAVAGSRLGSATAIADGALAAAAAQFGMRLEGAEEWVDHDPETGEVLLPGLDDQAEGRLDDMTAQVAALGASEGPRAAAPEPAPHADAPAADDRPEAHQMIDRLVERLKAEGLGTAAAKLVVQYGGYGRDVEESRELYGRLRALLMHKVTVPS